LNKHFFVRENWACGCDLCKTRSDRYWSSQWVQRLKRGKSLKRRIVVSNTVLLASAECETGFSACKDTLFQTRNRLCAKSLSALLFVDLNGPPLDRFDPAPVVQSRIKAGHRTSASWGSNAGPQPQPAEIRPL